MGILKIFPTLNSLNFGLDKRSISRYALDKADILVGLGRDKEANLILEQAI